MITWFSAVRRAALAGILGGLLGGPGAGAATAAEPSPPPGAAAPAPSAKVQSKLALSEGRLTAGRAAAAAGKAPNARALYGEALAAGLAAQGQALAEGEAPRPTSVVVLANEQPAEESLEPTPAPDAEAARREAEERATRERAEAAAREEAARQEAARQETARQEAERQAAAAAAPVVVIRAPVAPPAAPPAVFQAGLRLAPQAKDATGSGHVSAGLVFTWLTLATPYGRGSAVVDLESSRWQPGRGDMTERAQVAFYGLGFDWTVPFASHGTGMYVGAEAAGGVLQSTRMTSTDVATDGVLMLTPHVGGAVAYRGVGLFVDAGYRVQVLADKATSGSASEGGFLLQGGLRVEMPRGDGGQMGEPGPFALGYAARFYSPNGSRVWNRYGGLFGADAGPLVGHELALTTGIGLPRILHLDYGVALTYLGASQDGGGSALTMLGAGALVTWHAFAAGQLFNPYLGGRAGGVYVSSDDSTTFKYKSQVSPTASVMAGLDVAILRRVALRAGVAYDAVANANDKANASLSGYAIEAGVTVRP
jgi:hypothetical protein